MKISSFDRLLLKRKSKTKIVTPNINYLAWWHESLDVPVVIKIKYLIIQWISEKILMQVTTFNIKEW